jgi:hypothetical protein
MFKTLRIVGPLVCLLLLVSIAGAQALPAAYGPGRLQAGFTVSYARPDFWVQPNVGDPKYSRQFILGVSGYADYQLNDHLSLEGDFHCVCLITSLDRGEITVLIGPRLTYPMGRFDLYAKGLIGIHDLDIQEWQDNVGLDGGPGSAYAVGGGVDFIKSHKIMLRLLDIELQKWPTFVPRGINPIVISSGFAYRFH